MFFRIDWWLFPRSSGAPSQTSWSSVSSAATKWCPCSFAAHTTRSIGPKLKTLLWLSCTAWPKMWVQARVNASTLQPAWTLPLVCHKSCSFPMIFPWTIGRSSPAGSSYWVYSAWWPHRFLFPWDPWSNSGSAASLPCNSRVRVPR